MISTRLRAAMIVVTPSVSLRDDEFTERMVKASGPGGQHVNKTSNAVELRFDVRGHRWRMT